MALQMTVTKSAYGQDVKIVNAYHRIEHIEGDKNEIIFKLCTYSPDLEHLVHSQHYKFNPSQEDNALRWDKQAYEYLKTTEYFSIADDV